MVEINCSCSRACTHHKAFYESNMKQLCCLNASDTSQLLGYFSLDKEICSTQSRSSLIMNTQVINVGHKENGNKLVQQWLVATNINPAQRAVWFAMEIKSFETIAESPAI